MQWNQSISCAKQVMQVWEAFCCYDWVYSKDFCLPRCHKHESLLFTLLIIGTVSVSRSSWRRHRTNLPQYFFCHFSGIQAFFFPLSTPFPNLHLERMTYIQTFTWLVNKGATYSYIQAFEVFCCPFNKCTWHKMEKTAYSPFISAKNITTTCRTIILKMTETAVKIKKIELIKQIQNTFLARGRNGSLLQATSHSWMTKKLQKLFFQSSFFESFINHCCFVCK